MVTEAKGIAILGWGSLLWETHADFDSMHGPWLCDGPVISLEFSRISSSRLCALTLVIDPAHGQKTTVSYTMSKRKGLEDAIADLRCREGTTMQNIGYFQNEADQHKCRDKKSLDAISAWANERKISAVVWTDLESNFQDVCGKPFSVGAAVSHIQTLEPKAKVKAAEYIWRAPAFVKTDLRSTLQAAPWF